MDKKLEKIRHSLSHLMSMAVQEIYPKVGLGVGPAIEDGFYQDYDLPESITPEILPKLEKRMRELIKENIKFDQHDVGFDDAYKFYQHDPYKTWFIDDLKAKGEKKLSFYRSGWFDNLCAGPHVKSTKEIDPASFKLTRIAGAYWRGDEKNKMLQRIYGTAFESEEELSQYLKMLAEAEKRDHKRLGQELDLYSFHPESPGTAFFHNKGMIILDELINFWRLKHRQRGYLEVKTPIILSRGLWEQSGHWDLYKENMYTTKIDDIDYGIKPMNCLGGMLIYKEHKHSYRELPLRMGELGLVHRHELSGVLNGLLRVRSFTQDDAHIFCTPEQLEEEIIDIVKLIQEMLSVFGFQEYKFTLSIRGEKKKDKYLGTDKEWEWAQEAILAALKKLNLKSELVEGEAKFYGPSLDVQIKDALGREWQCSTIQLDFNLPKRFDITYVGPDAKEHTPYMLHRVIYGSLERFLGVLVEHYAGAFPLWLSPVQAVVIPVSEKFNDYAQKIKAELNQKNIRVEIDDNDESLGKRIRNAEKQKAPYILVVGEKEEKDKTVAVRKRGQGDLGAQKLEKFIEQIEEEIRDKK